MSAWLKPVADSDGLSSIEEDNTTELVNQAVVGSEATDASASSKPFDVAFAEVSIEERNTALVVVVNDAVLESEAGVAFTEVFTKSQISELKWRFFKLNVSCYVTVLLHVDAWWRTYKIVSASLVPMK